VVIADVSRIKFQALASTTGCSCASRCRRLKIPAVSNGDLLLYCFAYQLVGWPQNQRRSVAPSSLPHHSSSDEGPPPSVAVRRDQPHQGRRAVSLTTQPAVQVREIAVAALGFVDGSGFRERRFCDCRGATGRFSFCPEGCLRVLR